MMEFYAVLDQVVELLRQRGRVTYRALKLQFTLDDNALETLKEELIDAQRLAVDEQGKVLIWTGNSASATPPALGQDQEHVPLAYTPPHLTDKILAARPALEGERKQVTVLFADLKDSTELIRGLDPEAAQQLLDPAIQLMMDAVHRFEGTVNQVLGDGIMALFGAPDCPRRPRPARLLRGPGHAGGHAAHHRGGTPHAWPGAAHARGPQLRRSGGAGHW